MAQEVNTAGSDYIHPGETKFIGGLYVPSLANITDPPLDQGKPAIGVYNNNIYNWDVTNQVWKQSGSDATGDTVSGTYTVVGDGTTSSFSWAHGLGFNPTASGFTIDPVTAPAQGIFNKAADGTSFTVYYDVCPVGTLKFNWTAKQV